MSGDKLPYDAKLEEAMRIPWAVPTTYPVPDRATVATLTDQERSRLRRAEQRAAALERQNERLRRDLARKEEAASRWRLRALALGWVLCSGCGSGTTLTEAMVVAAEENAPRMRSALNHQRSFIFRRPHEDQVQS